MQYIAIAFLSFKPSKQRSADFSDILLKNLQKGNNDMLIIYICASFHQSAVDIICSKKKKLYSNWWWKCKEMKNFPTHSAACHEYTPHHCSKPYCHTCAYLYICMYLCSTYIQTSMEYV